MPNSKDGVSAETAPNLADAIFRPRGIALVGASADENKINARPQAYLRAAGYGGFVAPINPRADMIGGVRAYGSVLDVAAPIDHAFVMVPADRVAEVVRECGAAGVSVATIFSAGFAELGADGAAAQKELATVAREAGVRLVGPNCIGLIDVHHRMPLTTNAAIAKEQLVAGGVSVISQSGSMLGSLITRAAPRGMGFAKLVSIGNEADLGVGEIAQHVIDDEESDVLLLFLETIRDPDTLAAAARRAHQLGKPVIAYKLGRSNIGRRIAASHTGAIVGSDEIASAFFRDNGILRVETLDGFLELPALVRGKQPPKGRRAGMMTATGGAAAMIADRLGIMGDMVPIPPEELRASLAGKGIHISDSPLIDLPMGSSDGGRYAEVLGTLLASDYCDIVVSVIGSSARSRPEIVKERITSARMTDKPLAVFLAPQADEALKLLQQEGIAGFRTPESCADAVHAYLNWTAPSERTGAYAPPQAHELVRDTESWTEETATGLFSALGVPVVESEFVSEARIPHWRSDDDALRVVKCLSPDIGHKSDAGLVWLSVPPQEVAATGAELIALARRTRPDARIEGVLVQRMETGLMEVMLGFRRDPEAGPVVVVSTGGVAAEIRPSISVRLAPVTAQVAGEMLKEIPELRLVSGFRNLPQSDLDALAQAVARFSQLAALSDIAEAEANPVLLREGEAGPVAVDGLVIVRQAT